jgi:predicted ATPase
MINEKLRRFFVEPDPESERRILYLTGLAGSGKTTIGRALEQRLNATLVSEFIDPLPDSVMDTRVDSEYEQKVRAQQWALGQYRQKNALIGELSGNVIIDRTWVDALVYSQIYGKDVLQAISTEAERDNWHLGIYVIMFADEMVIKERLQQKFGLSENEWSNSWKPYIRDLRQSVIELATTSSLLAIDTSDLSVESASEIIEKKFIGHFRE